jgi:hypothetical protein
MHHLQFMNIKLVRSIVVSVCLGCLAHSLALAQLAINPQNTPAAGRQVLRGHVPEAIARLNLQPVGRLPATNRLRLAIGLPLRNTNALNKLLQDMYDPASPQFRHYLTPEQFTEKFGPTQQDYDALVQFAKGHALDIAATSSNRVLLDVAGQVSDIEKAFQITLRTYQHPREARQFYAPDVEPSVDASLKILDTSGLNNYSRPRPALHRASGTTAAHPASGSGPGGMRRESLRPAQARRSGWWPFQPSIPATSQLMRLWRVCRTCPSRLFCWMDLMGFLLGIIQKPQSKLP